MAKKKEQKREILRNLTEKLGKAKSVIFASFNALGVKDNEAMRKNIKAVEGEYYVAKKTLLNLALQEKKIDGVKTDSFQGQVAVIFGYGDEVAPLKVIDEFKKAKEKKDKISFLAGIFEGNVIGEKEISVLAKLPGRQELYAKLVGSLNAPVAGFVNALAGNLRNLVYVLNAIKDKK